MVSGDLFVQALWQKHHYIWLATAIYRRVSLLVHEGPFWCMDTLPSFNWISVYMKGKQAFKHLINCLINLILLVYILFLWNGAMTRIPCPSLIAFEQSGLQGWFNVLFLKSQLYCFVLEITHILHKVRITDFCPWRLLTKQIVFITVLQHQIQWCISSLQNVLC